MWIFKFSETRNVYVYEGSPQSSPLPLRVYITEEFSPGFTRNPTAEGFVRIPAILIKMLD